MSSEYIKISNPEKIYGQKNLLQAQIELLQVMQRYKTFEKLRKEELILKVVLKTKIEEAESSLHLLDKLLPKSTFKLEKDKEKQSKDLLLYKKEKLTLEQEINRIKEKLTRLH